MLALYVPYNMFSSPLCVITCLASFVLAMLALCHHFWLSLFFFFFFASLFMSSCLCLYVLVCVIKLGSYP